LSTRDATLGYISLESRLLAKEIQGINETPDLEEEKKSNY
jgi:hypothetical protein